MESNNDEKRSVPEDDAWWPSKLLFVWMRPLFQRAQEQKRAENRSALQQEDLIPLPDYDHGEVIAVDFERAWAKLQSESDQDDDGTAHKLEEIDASNAATDIVRKAVTAVIGRRFIIAGFIKMFNTCLQFSFPILLNLILTFIEDTQAGKIADDAKWSKKYAGYWLSAILFVAMASKAVTENSYFHRVYRSGYQARVAVSVSVYNKSLRLANAERQSTTLGELVNLMQVDATKIEMFIPQFHVLWDGLLQITGYMVILYTLIGWPCFAGLLIMMAAGPVQGVIMKKLFGLNRQMVAFTDARVKTTNEALQGMQSVKMFAWEDNFAAAVGGSRDKELSFLRRVSYLRGFSRAYMSALPGLVAVASFVVFALAYTGADVSASTLFAALVAFDQLRFPLLFYPVSLAQLVQAKVSAARVQRFLTMREVGRGEKIGNGNFKRNENAEGEIEVEDATIYWSDPNIPLDESQHSSKSSKKLGSTGTDTDSETPERFPKAILSHVSMRVKPGELCAVVGRVGSGKSTLCSAILNETLLESGDITLSGKVAYAAQSPWILNATLRDNILFGMPFDQKRYSEILDVCQLSHDLKMLDDGDMTEIGEKGINLSGGQKQRVSIARACYSNADTILFDDPLSALDPEVGKKLFDACINKYMNGKTRLLVTNQLQFLKWCDSVVALGGGTVIEQGSFSDLIADENGEVNRLLKESEKDKSGSSDNDQSEGKKSGATSKKEAEAAVDTPAGPAKEAQALVTKEERAIGAVSWSVYRRYLKSGGGFVKFAIVYFGFLLSVGNGIANTSWVSYWTSDAPGYTRHSEAFYLGLFFMLSVTLGIFTFFRAFLLARFGVDASEKLHRDLLDSILRAPQSFFDTTPLGRILSRFSKDMYSIDIELADYFDFFLSCSLMVTASLATIMFVTPWFGVAIVPLGFIYFKVLNYFREVARETKRLESISRSPVFAHFSETLGGLTTIRAYGQAPRFMGDFEKKVDNNTQAYYNNKGADRWLSVRLELIGSVVAGLAAVFASNVAIAGSVAGQESDSNFSSLAGLSLSLAISLTGLLNWCVRSFAQLEAAMNACERVLYYTEEIQREAARTSDELERNFTGSKGNPKASTSSMGPSTYAMVANNGKTATFSEEWPEKGDIVLKNLKMRYRPETPLVLKGLNVKIEGGQRIGVVGRTGSGKSSLLLTLLRLVEPSIDATEPYEAPIEIDGVDVLRIGVRELRSRLGIIPQNPVLFSGTIRDNIDPFDKYTDSQIWEALEQCHMREAVEEMPGELDAPVSEYGENLSAGMRQMLVLGRALLRQCRILLLDEATSNVDLETDRKIQTTLREAFPGCTVLTIAHRVNTIMDSDKILVMSDGYAKEFDAPQALLANEDSLFKAIVHHAEAESEN